MSREPFQIGKTGWDELAEMPGTLKTGDVIHVQSQGLLSRLIRWFSRGWGEKKTWASHSALVLTVAEDIEIIEALTRVTRRPISAYAKKKSKLLVSRIPGGLDSEQKVQVIRKAEDYHGRVYGFIKLLPHALDRLFDNKYVFRRLLWIDDYPICSWLVAYVYDRLLKYQFGTPPNAAQPDDLLDHCVKTHWDFVWSDSEESVAGFCGIYELKRHKDDMGSKANETQNMNPPHSSNDNRAS